MRMLSPTTALLTMIALLPLGPIIAAPRPSTTGHGRASTPARGGDAITVSPRSAGFHIDALNAGASFRRPSSAGPGWTWREDATHHVRLPYPSSWRSRTFTSAPRGASCSTCVASDPQGVRCQP